MIKEESNEKDERKNGVFSLKWSESKEMNYVSKENKGGSWMNGKRENDERRRSLRKNVKQWADLWPRREIKIGEELGLKRV